MPGHEIVGTVDALGPGAARFAVGDRIGVAWLRGTCGRCRWCRTGRENLCPEARFTGWDTDGGYAAILFAPAGELVPVAMRALDQGGTLAVAGIHLSDIPPMVYAAELFREKQLRSVTANTRADGEEFLRLAAALHVRPSVEVRRSRRPARRWRTSPRTG